MDEQRASYVPIICIGEALIDRVSQDGHIQDFVGGSVLNVAAGLAALHHDTHLASWWADDDYGHLIDNFTSASGVHVLLASRGGSHTTIAHATIDSAGHARYSFDLEWQVPPIDSLEDFAHLHIGSYAATLTPGFDRISQIIRAFSHIGTISYDPNIRPSIMGEIHHVRSQVESHIGYATVVKASDEDLSWLYPGRDLIETMNDWLDRGPDLVVITCGKEGALIAHTSTSAYQVDAFPTIVGDTVGAGDSFMAGLISGLIKAGALGADPSLALSHASREELSSAIMTALATSSLTVSKIGAYAPSRDEISHIMHL